MNDKTATLKLHLKSDSGYSSSESHRVSPKQWEDILKICNETELPDELPDSLSKDLLKPIIESAIKRIAIDFAVYAFAQEEDGLKLAWGGGANGNEAWEFLDSIFERYLAEGEQAESGKGDTAEWE